MSLTQLMPALTRNRWLVALCFSVGCHVALGRLAGAVMDEAGGRPAPRWTSAWVGEAVDVETVLTESPSGGNPPSAVPEDVVAAPVAVDANRTATPAGTPRAPSVTADDQPKRSDSHDQAVSESMARPAPGASTSSEAAEGAQSRDPLAAAAARALTFRPEATPAGASEPGAEAGTPHETAGRRDSTFGSVGMPPGVRELGAALTRNLPLAAQNEPTWDRVALGSEERAVVWIALSEAGRVSEWQLEPRAESEHPRRIKELARRAVALLGQGQFALGTGFGAGRQRVELVVRVEQGNPHGDDSVRPEDLFAQGSEPPAGDRPGRAYLRRNSGRVLRMELWLLSD